MACLPGPVVEEVECDKDLEGDIVAFFCVALWLDPTDGCAGG